MAGSTRPEMGRVQVLLSLWIDLPVPKPPMAEVLFATRLPLRKTLQRVKPTLRAPQHRPLALGAGLRRASERLGAQRRPFAMAALRVGDIAVL